MSFNFQTVGNDWERGSEAEGPTPGASDSSFSLADLWLAVRNNIWLVAAAVVLVVAASAYYTSTRTRMYRAVATVRFDPQPARPLGDRVTDVADIQSDYWDRQEYYNTQHWEIQARTTALPVVREFSLHRNPGFVNNKPDDRVIGEDYLDESMAAEVIQSRLSVQGIDESRLARITYTDANPERAQRILAAVLRSYSELHRAELRDVSDEASEWLGSQVTTLKDRLEESELELHKYKKDKEILDVSADDQSALLQTKLSHLTQALTQAEAHRAHVGSRRDELRKVKADDPETLPVSELMLSSVLNGLRASYVAASTDLESLLGAGRGENHPEVAAARARKSTAQRLLLAEVSNIKESVEKDYNAASKEIASLNGLVDVSRKQAMELNLLGIEFKRLERTRDTNERLYELVTERSKQTDLTRMLQPNNVKVLDPPERPMFPFAPNVSLNLMAGLFGGLALGLLLAIGREQLNSTIRSPEAAEQVLKLPFLGILPLLKPQSLAERLPRFGRKKKAKASQTAPTPGRRSELTVHYEPQSGIAEAARAIRTNLLLGSHNAQLLLVTSSAPGEGKTTVACALATSLANAGQKVCIVDCDLRRPRLHRVFEVPNDLGTTSVAQGTVDLDSAIVPTLVGNLSLLPSGHLPVHPSEFLHGDAFALLIRELRSRFDKVVLDSPPLIPVTDAAILASQADATVLVTRAFETKKHTARRAARVLKDVNANVIGSVLNAVDFERGEYRYYQYYDYANRPPESVLPKR